MQALTTTLTRTVALELDDLPHPPPFQKQNRSKQTNKHTHTNKQTNKQTNKPALTQTLNRDPGLFPAFLHFLVPNPELTTNTDSMGSRGQHGPPNRH